MTEPVWLVVGLGNPGPSYAGNRHNVGYLVNDELATRVGGSFRAHKTGRADVVEGRIGGPGGPRVVLARPRCYMNESGGPVSALAKFYKVPVERILAVHWRLRQFRLDGKAIEDWENKAKNDWFPLNVAGLPMVGGDLALGGVALVDAPEDLFDLASSIAQERHQAINWLAGECEIYSETDTST